MITLTYDTGIEYKVIRGPDLMICAYYANVVKGVPVTELRKYYNLTLIHLN